MLGIDEATSSVEGRTDLRILSSLRRIIRAVDVHSRKLKSFHEITAPQLICLLTVVQYGPLTPSAIGKRIHLSNSTIVGILDRLEARGLLRRERSTQDRRQIYVSATSRGRRMAADAPSPLQDMLAGALKRLPAQEQLDIASSLERIVELMEAGQLESSAIVEIEAVEGRLESEIIPDA